MDPLSPREIQARVRAGESPEVIAAETGWPLDRVQRYAEPPLAERAFIASQAQQAEIRRSGGAVLLADTVEHAMARAGRDADEVEWDAWRREDGRWIVTATAPGAAATWTYDVAGRSVHPLDDSARRLIGIEDGPAPAATSPLERPRLVAVPEPEQEFVEVVATVVETVEVTETFTARPQHGEAASTPSRPMDVLFPPDPQDTVVIERETTPAAESKSPAAKRGKGRRASVPSWDEILFGAPRED